MENMLERLERIRRQVEGLLAERARLQRELDQARQRIWELEQALDLSKNERFELEETNKMLKLAKVLKPESSDKKAMKLKINELVREIDRCIDILSA
jgi:chromosome segregation ATPase